MNRPIRPLALAWLVLLLASAGAVREPEVEVRSSVDVPLAYVEVWEARGLRWRRYEAADGRVRVPAALAGRELRAPGHPRQVVRGSGGPLRLRAQASFEVVVRDLEAVRSLEPRRPPYYSPIDPSEAAFGWVDERRWRVAVVPGRFDVLDVRLAHVDGSTSTATFRIEKGLHGVWAPELVETGARLPLELELVGPDHPRGETSVAVTVRRAADVPAEIVERHDWGLVTHSRPRDFVVAARELAAGIDRVRFDLSAAWDEVHVRARSFTTGAHGSLVAVHDGTPRRLVLEPGLVVRGRLVDPQGAPLTGDANVRWGRRLPDEADAEPGSSPDGPDGSERNQAQQMLEEPYRLGRDGRFELVGSRDRRLALGRELPSPDAPLVVEVELGGYQPGAFELDVGARHTFDAGDLVLEPRAPDLVLLPARASGDGRSVVAPLPAAGSIRLVRIQGRRVRYVERVRRTERDELELVLRWPLYDVAGSRDGRPNVQPMPPDAVTAVLVDGPLNAGFARDERGDLRRVPPAHYELELVGEARWQARARWRSLALTTERDTTPDGALLLRFTAPREGVELHVPGAEHPLRPGRQRIEL